MGKTYSLLVFIRTRSKPFHFIVEKGDYDRLSNILGSSDDSASRGFFWCDTCKGRSVIINLKAIQAVRFLRDGPFGRPEQEEEEEGGLIEIYLRGRVEPINAETDSPESIHDFFSELELDPKMFPFPNFIDSDGEYVYVNSSEIDLIIAPSDLLDEDPDIGQDELKERASRPKPTLVKKK